MSKECEQYFTSVKKAKRKAKQLNQEGVEEVEVTNDEKGMIVLKWKDK